MADPVKYHIRHSAKGCKAWEDNRALAHALKQAKKTPSLFQSSPGQQNRHSWFVFGILSQLNELEMSRVSGEQRLRQAVIEMCEASVQTFTGPNNMQQDHQQNLKKAVAHLNIEIESFVQLIDQLGEQFSQLITNGFVEKGNSSSTQAKFAPKPLPIVPLATYTKTNLTLAIKKQEKANITAVFGPSTSKEASPAQTTNTQCSSLSFQTHPHYIDYLLGEIGTCLSSLSDYMLDKNDFHKSVNGSTVHQGTLIKDMNMQVALKVKKITQQNVQNIVEEVKIVTCKELQRHLHILVAEKCSIFRTLNSDYYVALTFKEMPHGNLANYIHHRWPERIIACLMKQVMEALKYIHSRQILHNDVQPSSILFNNGIVKLCGFGHAMPLTEFKASKCVTSRYMAPEVAKARLKGMQTVENIKNIGAIDIYSLGAILYQILEGKLPFHNYSDQILLDVISTEQLVFPVIDNNSLEVKDFLLLMIETNTELRATINALFTHPFIVKASSTLELSHFIGQYLPQHTQL